MIIEADAIETAARIGDTMAETVEMLFKIDNIKTVEATSNVVDDPDAKGVDSEAETETAVDTVTVDLVDIDTVDTSTNDINTMNTANKITGLVHCISSSNVADIMSCESTRGGPKISPKISAKVSTEIGQKHPENDLKNGQISTKNGLNTDGDKLFYDSVTGPEPENIKDISESDGKSRNLVRDLGQNLVQKAREGVDIENHGKSELGGSCVNSKKCDIVTMKNVKSSTPKFPPKSEKSEKLRPKVEKMYENIKRGD